VLRVAGMLALLLPLLALAPVTPAQAMRAEPAVLVAAAAQPAAHLQVIVQKTTRAAQTESLVTRLGGRVTKNLQIIQAFAADLPAAAVPALAQDSGVRWISLDAPVNGTAADDTTFTTWATEPGVVPGVTKAATFNSQPIYAGSYIWFNSTVNPSVRGPQPVTIYFDNGAIQYAGYGLNLSLSIPGAAITFDPAATTATTTFDSDNDRWVTRVPAGTPGDIFATGLGLQAPATLPGGITPISITGRLTTDTPGMTVNWKWGAAVYSQFSTDINVLNVKPVDGYNASAYKNSDPAGTPETYKARLVPGALSWGGTNYTGSTGSVAATPAVVFSNVPALTDSAPGPNGTFAVGRDARMAVGGFSAEISPGNAISRVEAVLQAYVPARLGDGEDPALLVSVGGQAGAPVVLDHHAFDAVTGAANAGPIYVDLTANRNWSWADFDNGLELTIDARALRAPHAIYYDAVGLRVTSSPGADNTGGTAPTSLPSTTVGLTAPANAYPSAVRANALWNEPPAKLQGQGTTVAVIDSGIFRTKDLGKRVIGSNNFNRGEHDSVDSYGHGTFVAGIVAGDGSYSHGEYMGIAPKANILNVRVSDDAGAATESDVVLGMEWVYNNKSRYNIKVANLSLNTTHAQSYHTSPLCAAAEVLWFNGIVVVTSAGNNQTQGGVYPPANDPFVITVGATDDKGTAGIADDTLASFSAYGPTESGFAKPDLVAPGTDIIGLLPQQDALKISKDHGSNRVSTNYFRMSGTSMAAPMVSGAAALLLQDEPRLTPDQVKYRLMATAVHDSRWPAYNAGSAGSGYLDIYAAVHGSTTGSANTGIAASRLLWTGTQPITWGSVSWNSVSWNSVSWNSVSWNSVSWNSVSWNSDYWGP
jgi:serine protease AprX